VSNPTPANCPTTTKARHYRIAGLSINEINRVLQDIGLRLDQAGAIAQNPDFKGRRIVNIRRALNPDDGVRKDQAVMVSDIAGLLLAGTAIEVSYNSTTLTWTVSVKIKDDNGLASDGNGIYVKRKADYGIDVDADGLKLLKQSHIADAAAVSALTLNAGADSVDRAAFNTALGTLVTEINAIKTVVNSILSNLENAKINATV